MSRAIILAEFAFNGSVIKDISAVSEGEVPRAKEVPYVGRTGSARLAPKYNFSFKYKPPTIGRIDFSQVDYDGGDVTFTLYYDGGGKRVYHGIDLLTEGGNELDGQNEVEIEYSFLAAKREGP